MCKLNGRVTREKLLTSECLIEMLVRFAMERNDRSLRKFIVEFRKSRAQVTRANGYLIRIRIIFYRMRERNSSNVC